MSTYGNQRSEVMHRLGVVVYLNRERFTFAIALHRALGWPLYGLMQHRIIRHAVVLDPKTERLYDVRGQVVADTLGHPFYMVQPFVLEEITASDLFKICSISEFSLKLAQNFAQLLFPNLPWRVAET